MEKVTIRIDLEGELAEKFLKLKKKWALKTNSDTIRHMIQRMHDLESQ